MMNPDVSMRPTILLLREGTDDSQVRCAMRKGCCSTRWQCPLSAASLPTRAGVPGEDAATNKAVTVLLLDACIAFHSFPARLVGCLRRTMQGKGQLISNINACQAVAEAVRTTLGPRGMDKLIHDGTKVRQRP